MQLFEPHPKDTVQRRGSRDPDPSFLINSRQEGLSIYYHIKTKGSKTKSFTQTHCKVGDDRGHTKAAIITPQAPLKPVTSKRDGTRGQRTAATSRILRS